MLVDSLRRLHFSDEESDRLIELDEAEAEAVAHHLVPVVGKLIEERLTMAHHEGYYDGWTDRGYL